MQRHAAAVTDYDEARSIKAGHFDLQPLDRRIDVPHGCATRSFFAQYIPRLERWRSSRCMPRRSIEPMAESETPKWGANHSFSKSVAGLFQSPKRLPIEEDEMRQA